MTLRKHRWGKGQELMERIFSLLHVFLHALHPKRK